MYQVGALEDIPPEMVIRNEGGGGDRPAARVYPFLWKSAIKPRDPTNAFLVRYELGTHSNTHYHAVDQFQIVVEGRGVLGRHELTPYSVHFSRAYTPYGPLLPDKQEGWAFVTLRARRDTEGAQRLSVAREKLEKIPNRRPQQISCKADFVRADAAVKMAEIAGIKDDQGLCAYTLTMPADARSMAPDPSGGDGQYMLAVKGGFIHGDRHYAAPAVVLVKPDEPPFLLLAGSSGLDALIVNFPRVATGDASVARHSELTDGVQPWQCRLCAFAYDQARGLPDDGIAPGTRWTDIPEDWSCPDCGASKSDFAPAGR